MAQAGTIRSSVGLGRILVVEDERVVARDLAMALSDLGYMVVATAARSEDAVQKARELRPNVVLMDIRLAGDIDGISTAETIKKERDIPVIFLTAYTDDETLRRAQGTEPYAYLVKPLNVPELRCAIEIALHKHEIGARLREREQWLATTLRSIRDGVVATDAEEKITFLNPVAEALTGWPQGAAFGRTLDEIMTLIAGGTRTRIDSPVHRALKESTVTTLQADALLVSRSGAAIPIDDSAAPIVSEKGDVLGGVMVFRDVTAQRKAEKEIRRLNAELEQRIVVRTEQLEAANRELEAFSYSVAHDLRAPLRGIDGVSQELIEGNVTNLGAEGLEQLRRIRGAAQRMGALIDDLLRLARTARGDVHKCSVDLSRLARIIRAELDVAHPNRDVECVIQDGVVVDGDERLLEIMLENLLGNAWKFTSKVASPRVEFGWLDQGGVAVCFVRDNGAGFDMEYAHKMFGAFQRLHSADEFEGTGIGLAIVQRVINRHGGRIWAESAVGRGATFYFVV